MPRCGCGCGEPTEGGTFRPGHDQKLRAELERRAGGILSLARLIDTAERYAMEQAPLKELGDAARQACYRR
jgi:hypothetical protein